MSREQGPREAGMRPAAIVASRRHFGVTGCDTGAEAAT
jgi:hypothetical protein